MSRSDPRRALIRALTARYPGLTVASARVTPWASATFTGARHELTCTPGVDLTGIEDAEFALAGHLVADVTASGSIIEVLTIEAE